MLTSKIRICSEFVFSLNKLCTVKTVKMSSFKFIDIGANLTDDMYSGSYHGSKKHEPDLDDVLQRCWAGGMQKMIVTGGSVADCKKALHLAQSDSRLYATVGCHPTRCNEFLSDPQAYLHSLKEIVESAPDKVVAIGECGLDYDRLQFCPADVQKKFFEYQLSLCDDFRLPLFLHCRAAWDDFFDIAKRNSIGHGGVIHSFDGSMENMKTAVQMGFYIGINGCSLKTEDNLLVAAAIPEDKILIETDCPWCEIKASHASAKHVKTQHPSNKKEKFVKGKMVKGRNEPANIKQILEVLSSIRNVEERVLSEAIFDNTVRLFFEGEK